MLSYEEAKAILDEFNEAKPATRAKMCDGCPFSRTSTPGYLGPHTAKEWADMAHSDAPMACHETIRQDEHWTEGTKQCRGMAIFRANIAKRPANPIIETGPRDTALVFGWDDEMRRHHGEA